MRNAAIRFAIDDDGSIYDYRDNKSYRPEETPALDDAVSGGTWDLVKVKELIERGVSAETAFTKGELVSPPAINEEQANKDFVADAAGVEVSVSEDGTTVIAPAETQSETVEETEAQQEVDKVEEANKDFLETPVEPPPAAE